MRTISIVFMSLSLLSSCFGIVVAFKDLWDVSRIARRRILPGFIGFLGLYISLVFSLLAVLNELAIEWFIFRWGFVPLLGILGMAGVIVSGVTEAYQHGKKDGESRA